jgi:hypothetical protein
VHETLETGPLYEQVARSMATYRSIAARMQNAKASTQGKLDRQLERWAEQISLQLADLTDQDRNALCCWENGNTPGAFQIDHAAIMDRPYVSIRKVNRWVEEHDVDELKKADKEASADDSEKLQAFLNINNDDL